MYICLLAEKNKKTDTTTKTDYRMKLIPTVFTILCKSHLIFNFGSVFLCNFLNAKVRQLELT